MRKGLILALLAAFCVVSFSAVVIAQELTIDAPAEKFPAKKLKDGAKKKPPVTFDHGKHGQDFGCVECHHTQPDLAAGGQGQSCFECHGPEADGNKVDTYDMIHKGKCVPCHKEKGGNAPTGCNDCHKK